MYHNRLKEVFSNFEFKNNRLDGLKIDNKVLSYKELIKKLEKINDVRNHVAHNLFIMDTSTRKYLKPFEKTKADMFYKGSDKEIDEAIKYTQNFFKSIKVITEKTRKSNI